VSRMYLLKTIVLELSVIHVLRCSQCRSPMVPLIDLTYAMYTAGWKDGASGAFCTSGFTVGSTGRAVSRDASTEDLTFSSADMFAVVANEGLEWCQGEVAAGLSARAGEVG
jgi:hypothetical protein